MAKRSNAFQRLIKHIHEQMEPAGGTVEESAFLREKNIPDAVEREIDVLITRLVNSKPVRIAIECRDRHKRDDIQWIDELIGKYLNLPVHRVIAVSSSGFSDWAKIKALANNIELRTLKKALSSDWVAEFHKLGIVVTSRTLKVVSVSIEFSPPREKPDLSTPVYKNGDKMGTISDLLEIRYDQRARTNVVDYLSKHMLDIFKTRADLDREISITYPLPVTNLYIKDAAENIFNIKSVILKIRGAPYSKEIDVNRLAYEEARITKGMINIEGLDQIHKLYITQMRGSKDIKIFQDTREKSNNEKMKKDKSPN